MKIYFYSKSGHAVGLEATKRCATIANVFKKFDPILCTSDFRAGAFAKEQLGIKKYVNIDVIRNLTNIMQRNDILFYDSDEVNDQMKEEMKGYCSLVYNLNDISDIIVDETIYTKTNNPKLEKTIFLGDDDYNNLFLNLVKNSKNYDLNLLMGHYFFLGNEKTFKEHFKNVIDEEEYTETIRESRYLLTASLQTALESISCDNFPVLFIREDKKYNFDLITKLNIPLINSNELDSIIDEFENIILNYPKLSDFSNIDLTKIYEEVDNKIKLFDKLMNN